MADVRFESGSDAAVAYRLWTDLLKGGYAPDVTDRKGALSLFKECIETVRHKGNSQHGSLEFYEHNGL